MFSITFLKAFKKQKSNNFAKRIQKIINAEKTSRNRSTYYSNYTRN